MGQRSWSLAPSGGLDSLVEAYNQGRGQALQRKNLQEQMAQRQVELKNKIDTESEKLGAVTPEYDEQGNPTGRLLPNQSQRQALFSEANRNPNKGIATPEQSIPEDIKWQGQNAIDSNIKPGDPDPLLGDHKKDLELAKLKTQNAAKQTQGESTSPAAPGIDITKGPIYATKEAQQGMHEFAPPVPVGEDIDPATGKPRIHYAQMATKSNIEGPETPVTANVTRPTEAMPDLPNSYLRQLGEVTAKKRGEEMVLPDPLSDALGYPRGLTMPVSTANALVNHTLGMTSPGAAQVYDRIIKGDMTLPDAVEYVKSQTPGGVINEKTMSFLKSAAEQRNRIVNQEANRGLREKGQELSEKRFQETYGFDAKAEKLRGKIEKQLDASGLTRSRSSIESANALIHPGMNFQDLAVTMKDVLVAATRSARPAFSAEKTIDMPSLERDISRWDQYISSGESGIVPEVQVNQARNLVSRLLKAQEGSEKKIYSRSLREGIATKQITPEIANTLYQTHFGGGGLGEAPAHVGAPAVRSAQSPKPQAPTTNTQPKNIGKQDDAALHNLYLAMKPKWDESKGDATYRRRLLNRWAQESAKYSGTGKPIPWTEK